MVTSMPIYLYSGSRVHAILASRNGPACRFCSFPDGADHAVSFARLMPTRSPALIIWRVLSELRTQKAYQGSRACFLLLVSYYDAACINAWKRDKSLEENASLF